MTGADVKSWAETTTTASGRRRPTRTFLIQVCTAHSSPPPQAITAASILRRAQLSVRHHKCGFICYLQHNIRCRKLASQINDTIAACSARMLWCAS